MDFDEEGADVEELTEQDKTDIAKHVLDLSDTKIDELLQDVPIHDASSFRDKIATCREIANVIPSVRVKIQNTLKNKPQAAPVPVVPDVGVAANAGLGVGNDDNEADEENVEMGVSEANELSKNQQKILGRLRRYIRAWDVIFHLIQMGYLDDSPKSFVLKQFVFAYILNDKKALNTMFDNAGSTETTKYDLPNVNRDDEEYKKQIANLVFSICYAKNEATIKMTSDEAIQLVLNSYNAYKNLSFMANLYTTLTGDKTLQPLQAGSIDAENNNLEKDISVVQGNDVDEDIAGGGDNAPSQVSGSRSRSRSGSGSGSGGARDMSSSVFSSISPSLASLPAGSSFHSSSLVAVSPMDAANVEVLSDSKDVVDNAMSAAGGGGVDEFKKTRPRNRTLKDGEKDPWFTALVNEVKSRNLEIPKEVINNDTGEIRDTPGNRRRFVELLNPPKIRFSNRLVERVNARSSQIPGTGGRHFAMRAASFQRSRIAAILNSLYPIAV